MIPKFRAWDKETQLLINVLVIDWLNELVDLEGGRIDRQFDEVELIQSTGLKDKNGVEIFEGDIVVVEHHPFQRKENSGAGFNIEGKYVIQWNQHDLTWCAGDLLLARLKPYVRVIGNTWENSDLLGK
ncbi:YopX family protein [Enterococcus mundtii]|uniref:YopX protein domain-containing protein n=1 Tax=Enterococcus mundtii TaxID=53346 RepID=A0A242KYC3_ENTMU|nr:YopX family protein [Enterococcus mundtii]OTP26943.1 hypothetical protein A5802_000677 [Enterococcus mundtii]